MPLSRQTGLYAPRKQKLRKAAIAHGTCFFELLHARITRDADCYGQNDERGDFLFLYYKKKIPPHEC